MMLTILKVFYFALCFSFWCRNMSKARAKRILLSAQSTNKNIANTDVTNPDNALFQANQLPKLCEDTAIATISNIALGDFDTHMSSTLLESIQIHTQPTTTENEPETETIVSYHQNEYQLSEATTNTDDVPQVHNFLLFDDDINAPNNVQIEFIDQFVPPTDDINSYVITQGTDIALHPIVDEHTTTSPLLNDNINIPPRVDIPPISCTLDIHINPTPDVQEAITSSSLNNVARLVEYSESSESQDDTPLVKRKKRCQVDKKDWNIEKNRLNREKGIQYYGKRKVEGKWLQDVRKSKKEIKPRCKCQENKNGVFNCHLITENDRESLFKQFWAMDWGEKKIFVNCLIKCITPKRKRDRKDPNKSQRKNSMVYYLKKNDEMIRVCKTLFINTFSITTYQCWAWKEEKASQVSTTGVNDIHPDNQSTASTSNRVSSSEKTFLDSFLDELPKLPSHYCRQRTSMLYLQPEIISKQQLYKLYKEECNSKNVKPLSIATFSNALTLKKISLFIPKKDLCEICNGYVIGQISEDVYNEHIQKKVEARAEKQQDKKDHKFVFTADLQAVLLAPRSTVSSNYYKTKLCVHNWCIFDMKMEQGYCFVWNESEGGLNAEEFATIMSKFIVKEIIPQMDDKDRQIVFYTDGCTYQNRNVVLSNAFINVSIYYNITITHKYLEVGHTQMEVDSMHAMIEKRLKNQTIHAPAEYLNICRTAKTNNKKYRCEYLTFPYFKDFKEIALYKSIRPGKMKGDPKVYTSFLSFCMLCFKLR